MQQLAYYITPHGFGHAIRSFEVIRQLLELAADLEIIIVSTLPDYLLVRNVGKSLPIREKRLDIGMVQQDSLQFDLEATRRTVESLYHNRQTLLAEEMDFFKTHNIGAVVCDIPFLPLAAASRRGIPAIGIGNFTWDWIYQPYSSSDPRWDPLVAWIYDCYQECSLFLQLPMHGDCSACPNIEDVPLVARKAKREKEDIRNVLALPSDKRSYLVSFAALELDHEALNRVENIDHALFLYQSPLALELKNGICLDDFALPYADVVGAVDGVITKPGYGIVADCLSHGTPMVYSDRGFFREYDILVEEMRNHLATSYLSSPDLYAGRWQTAIKQLEKQPRKVPSLPLDGAEVCAQTILDFLEWST